ncbi:response regulator [Sulfitobacter sp. F26204]|uniref:response regulator n=1 Tax=Sulfitobacter sp. F26204 TaxID=2996014 RepID=UPI00225E6CFB|nr:response regulator [Sulfitobacter sp. F26204]MCX7560204.1 response regulator [Sulfitobacter sp. F26204]
MKILAVDDDPIILELLTQFVSAVGEHELTTATSGAEAIEIVSAGRGNEFDCFLFDIQMPHMDGIALTQSIRSSTRYADTPILMLTAMSDKRYVDAAFAAGATDYVTKPFELAELKARLGLVEGLIDARNSRTRKIFATQNLSGKTQAGNSSEMLELHEPISIYDVDNVIEYLAMENYVAQLSRGALFGSTTFAFTIRTIEKLFASLSAFEFSSLVSDVAEIISDTLANHQFLMSYAGSGTFVCVTESGWRPDMLALVNAVNLALARTELYDNTGQLLYVRVSAGEAIRLIWKSENSVMEAIGSAHASAEAASARHERAMNDLWLVEQRA